VFGVTLTTDLNVGPGLTTDLIVGPGRELKPIDVGGTNEQVIYWRTKAEVLAQEVAELNTKIQTLESRIEQRDSSLTEITDAWKALIVERDEITKQRNKAMSDYNTCMTRLNEALNNNIRLTSQLDEARKQVEDTDARTAAFIRKAYAQQYKPDLFTRFRNLRVVPFGHAPLQGTPQTRLGASLIWALGALYLIGRIE